MARADSEPRETDSLAENATCPQCGSRRIDRVDVIEQQVYRRIERIEDNGSVYGYRPISSHPDRPTGGAGRRGIGLSCADCPWAWWGDCGDAERSPVYQRVLKRLAGSGRADD